MPTAFETLVNDELPNRIATTEAAPAANSFPRYTGTAKLTTARTPAQVLADIAAAAATHSHAGTDLTSGLIPAARMQEVLALADLSDVTAKTGTGTVVAMSASPTLTGTALVAGLTASAIVQVDGSLYIPLKADPETPINGEIWLNSSLFKIKHAGGIKTVLLVGDALGTPASGGLINCTGFETDQNVLCSQVFGA